MGSPTDMKTKQAWNGLYTVGTLTVVKMQHNVTQPEMTGIN